MSTSQFPNEAASTQDDANELTLLESFEAGEWQTAPNKAKDIDRYRAFAAIALINSS